MKNLLLLFLTGFFSVAVVAGGNQPAVDVVVVGTIHTGIFAIGGETTGTTITADRERGRIWFYIVSYFSTENPSSLESKPRRQKLT